MLRKASNWLLIFWISSCPLYAQKFLQQTLKELGGASRTVQVSPMLSQTVIRQVAAVRPPATLPVSFKQQRQAALQMRPLLFKSLRWNTPLAQGVCYKNVSAGVDDFGNLTELNPQQWEEATRKYQQAMKAVQDLSGYMDKHIFYVGEYADRIEPEQIRQTLKDISRAQGLVRQARVPLGNLPVLEEASRYLENAKGFYMMLASGTYFEVNIKKQKPVERTDGHTYNTKEFALESDSSGREISVTRWFKPATWFGWNGWGATPKQLRVAVLQDDPDLIADIEKLQHHTPIKNWEIAYYQDPEYFLNQVPYAQYDLILMDVLMPNGGGRYLARQLRARGYEGSILTLSGFDATQGGELFFADGIDGMIDIYEYRGKRTDWLWTRLHNYFLLKKKYGWKH